MSKPANTVRGRQAPLREAYRQDAASAWVVDHACTAGRDIGDPYHGTVRFGSASAAEAEFSVHAALGGPHDAPVPGDLLCAALASCQESSLRMVADVYGVALSELKVAVQAHVDVRGTLGMDPKVPVAFQSLQVSVTARPAAGTDPQTWRRVLQAAERSCVVLQTLRAGVPVTVAFAQPADQAPGRQHE